MRILVIITENKIFASLYDTIFFESNFNNKKEKDIAINEAKSIAFDYCASYSVGEFYCDTVTIEKDMNNQEILQYLNSN
jgi:hypothetical protein